MKLRNTTDLPSALVREVLAFVRPPGVRAFDVMLRNGGAAPYAVAYGTAYPEGDPMHTLSRRGTPFVTLKITPDVTRLPQPPVQAVRSGYLPTPYLADRTEALVYIAAHELRHLWQARVPRGRRVWGARGQYSERDCDAYAIRMLRAWRREHPTPRWWKDNPMTTGSRLVYMEARAKLFSRVRSRLPLFEGEMLGLVEAT